MGLERKDRPNCKSLCRPCKEFGHSSVGYRRSGIKKKEDKMIRFII